MYQPFYYNLAFEERHSCRIVGCMYICTRYLDPFIQEYISVLDRPIRLLVYEQIARGPPEIERVTAESRVIVAVPMFCYVG